MDTRDLAVVYDVHPGPRMEFESRSGAWRWCVEGGSGGLTVLDSRKGCTGFVWVERLAMEWERPVWGAVRALCDLLSC